MTDFRTSAVKAYETLINFGVCKTPVSPLSILEQMKDVVLLTFDELGEKIGTDCRNVSTMFGKFRDAFSTICHTSEKQTRVVAYNDLLPFGILQGALAREMGHIVLQHTESNEETEAEAKCFANHLLCPRPLINIMQAISVRITEDFIGNMTGTQRQFLIDLRRTPGVDVPAKLNRFIANQFMIFAVNFVEYYRETAPRDWSAVADFGSFMDNYAE